ncbi:MAG: hypothetical protein A2218_03355 [Elusimicrobia bacterium RIFOXYA2_FULL_53_38]|nr:MAG: hypothetical protein A2218_03355 [Elusimicrobia bacterium RIFOXYA2_FULL_53_38]
MSKRAFIFLSRISISTRSFWTVPATAWADAALTASALRMSPAARAGGKETVFNSPFICSVISSSLT